MNRKTSAVLGALELGEAFEFRRNSEAVWFRTHNLPAQQHKPESKAHFDWLRKQPDQPDTELVAQLAEERQRQPARERTFGNLT